MKRLAVFSCILLIGATGQGRATAGVLPPDSTIAGQSQAALSALWWQTFLAIPAGQNPIADPTGAFAGAGNLGPVVLLAGSNSPAPVVRSIAIGSGQALFFPLINAVSFAEISAYGGGEANLRRDAAESLGISPTGQASNTSLFAKLDGVDLALPSPTTSLLDFRQHSPPGLFEASIPGDSVFGMAPFLPGQFPSVSDGWWLALAPVPAGHYQLHFGGTTTGIGAYAGQVITQDITYNLNVVPEPSSLALVGFAGLCLGCFGAWQGRVTKVSFAGVIR